MTIRCFTSSLSFEKYGIHSARNAARFRGVLVQPPVPVAFTSGQCPIRRAESLHKGSGTNIRVLTAGKMKLAFAAN